MDRRVFLVLGVLVFAAFSAAHSALPQSDGQRKVFNAPDRSPQAAFSNAILEGDTLYLAGSIGLDPKTGKAPEKIEDEIHFLLDGYRNLLNQAGFSMDDLVYVQISCTDLSQYDKFNTIYKGYFSKDLPTREFVGVAALLRGGHFEMQAIAVNHSARVHLVK